jgi:hypothetical protein
MRREGQTLDDALRPLQVELEEEKAETVITDEQPEEQPAA